MSELNYYILKPSFRFAEERVVERSNDRVSQITHTHNPNPPHVKTRILTIKPVYYTDNNF
jgi:hypothetical protein